MDMLKTDAQILLQILNIQDKDKLILIKEDTDSDGNFIIAHALRHIFQDENRGVCLVMLQNNLIHYQSVGKRLNYNLQENITTKRATIIEPLTTIVEDIGAANPKLLNSDTNIVVNNFCKEIENQLQDLLIKCSGLIYVIIDNLSCLLDIGWEFKHCMHFVNMLINLNDRVNVIVSVHQATSDDQHLATAMNYISDIVVSVESLKAGRSPIVTGIINIKRNDTSVENYHFKTSEKGNEETVRLRFKGKRNSTKPYNESDVKAKILLPLPSNYLLAVLGLILLVFTAVIVIEKQLPPGLKVIDEHKHPDRFIAERAYDHLRNLTSLGPRVAGSYINEVLTVNLLRKEIETIIKNAKKKHVIELDIQKVSGSFALEFLDGMTNVYNGLQNVVVRVGSHINSPHSLLINCHFDTVVDSPGGSDDGAGCAVMLEILRVISRSDRTLRHNIIFLFNGGEENFLPASHGFITQHKWAKEVRAFINLEACGAGGREILFQAGPNHPWILETYSEEVPYPYASSLAQEIFQSGVIPGDTDYRIFRDFGNLSGLDFAWSSNGYVYHTKFDTLDQVPLGSLQRTGDNILSLARGMAQGHQLADIENHRAGNLVFFDFLGAFVVRWPMLISDIINTLSVIFSIYTIMENSKENKNVVSKHNYFKRLFNAMGAVVGTWFASALFCLAIAISLNLLDRTMAWYGRPLWVFFLYMVPTTLASKFVIYMHAKYSHKDINVWPWTVFQIYYDAYQLIWTVVLTIGTILRIRSSFIALLSAVFMAVANLLKSKLFQKQRDGKWLIFHVLVLGLPFVQGFYLLIGALYLFIPIMGRAGAGNNSEILISLMISVLFALQVSFAVPLILLVMDPYKVLNLLLGVFLISVGVLLLTPLGFPYSGDPRAPAPQKFMLSHTKRTFHSAAGDVMHESSGYWIIDLDINSPHTVDRFVPEVATAQLIDKDCAAYLYCGLPYLVPVLSMIWKTHFIPAPPPIFEKPTVMKVLNRDKIKIGPSHMGFMLSPVSGVDLHNWSLPSVPLVTTVPWNNRKTYFVFYGTGYESVPLKLSMNFTVPKEHKGPIADVAVTGHYFFGKSKTSAEFQELIEKFPSWTAVTSWSSSYESWIF
ncbi:metallopeptidase m28 family member [Holotrichia oblita]|uniref:Metallopeptidase m28 family member n=1 Tax=Holotrichia oblita TaxID=644536 RepID=A0ACB9TQR7_HOLOL|nr:metallopeptidase m28 family member [Holotrichia oblita]